MSANMKCPRCHGSFSYANALQGIWACESCGGDLLTAAPLHGLLTELRISPAMLTELAAQAGGRSTLQCPSCSVFMTALPLKAVPTDWCGRCNSLWLDAGELHKISRGKMGKPAAAGLPAPVAPRQAPAPLGIGASTSNARNLLELFISESAQVHIKQQRHLSEMLVPVERANTYVVDVGHETGVAQEVGGGIGRILTRQLLGSHRTMDVTVSNGAMQPVLMLHRPFFWFFSDMGVLDGDGRTIGVVRRRFAFFARAYDLLDVRGAVFARIHGPFFRPWTFKVLDARGMQRGQITKRWGGLFNEAITDADRFTVDYGGHDWTVEQRSILLAAAISIDMDYFEKGSRRSGWLRLLGS